MAQEQNSAANAELVRTTNEFLDQTAARVAADQATERAWREEHRPGFEAAARAGGWSPDWVQRNVKPTPEMTNKEIVSEVHQLHSHFKNLSEEYNNAPASQRPQIREQMEPIVDREKELRREYTGRASQELAVQVRTPEVQVEYGR